MPSIHKLLLVISTLFLITSVYSLTSLLRPQEPVHAPTRDVPSYITTGLEICDSLRDLPGPAPGFHERTRSDRFVPGTRAVRIVNGKLWTGADAGKEILEGQDLLMDGGIIKAIGKKDIDALRLKEADVDVFDAKGSWITPGIVDMHSHAGIEPSPHLEGSASGNSFVANIQPFLRALDGVNTHDLSFERAVAGGVTTSLILPGSGSGIGGQAAAFKYVREIVGKNETGTVRLELFESGLEWGSRGKGDDRSVRRTGRWRYFKVSTS